jgi:hypothetical protein
MAQGFADLKFLEFLQALSSPRQKPIHHPVKNMRKIVEKVLSLPTQVEHFL